MKSDSVISQNEINYNRIAKAIEFISDNFKKQPSLKEMAESVHLSQFHFQRLFTQWAGVSPKKFMQYISVAHAKKILNQKQSTLFDTAHDIGLSSTSRLHDLFINIEGMTPAEYKNGGQTLTINYSYANCPFGNIVIASTARGICAMEFYQDQDRALDNVRSSFPKATFHQVIDGVQKDALSIFRNDWNHLDKIKLHLHGTAFQLKVWEALLKVPKGGLSTYGAIARETGNPRASRAVGTAIGNNPVAFLIPCHRVIRSSGEIGGYMWGTTRKMAILGWEASSVNT
ncbi:MAG: methylated-DNA--[protein]-cysteine S-methyltransferase [Bacteroidia bacterium]|nr:methylated-DNA--[protein]-cysteine S-methyltransferase [Bacteroidia bacterium]